MFCKNCGNKLSNNSTFCNVCGTKRDPEINQVFIQEDTQSVETEQPLHPPLQQTINPQMAYVPPIHTASTESKKPNLWLIIAIIAAILAGLCVGAYFLFFNGKKTEKKTPVPLSSNSSSMDSLPTNSTVTNSTKIDPSAVDFSRTQDTSDLVGVWEGYFLYTSSEGSWSNISSYGIIVGNTQPIKLKIAPINPNQSELEGIMRIKQGDAAKWKVSSSDDLLELSGGWPGCEIEISLHKDAQNNGYTGTGNLSSMFDTSYAEFDIHIDKVDDSSWDISEFETKITESSPEQTSSDSIVETETVSEKTITLNSALDSGEGIYTGEMKDGVPHGQGKFTMKESDQGFIWNYEGQWEDGEMNGEGVREEGSFISTGTFRNGLLNGYTEIMDNGIPRYKGMVKDDSLNGQGSLYTKSGTLIFEGMFENDMLVESETDRKNRGETFILECEEMDEILYDNCMNEDNTFDNPVHVWGPTLGLSDQTASGNIIIGHFSDDSYPICLLYRYSVDEPKITGDDFISAWGVVNGLFEYTDINGEKASCPQVEVVYLSKDWNNE